MSAADVTRILLVEDDEDDYVLTQDLVREAERVSGERYTLDWEHTFEGGLAVMRANGHDVYLVDYRLGAHTGLDLIRAASAAECRGAVIMLTGQEDNEIDAEAVGAGASDYLIKGRISANALARAIRYAILRKRAESDALALAREQTAREAAEAALRARDEVLAVVSHDLRNPVGAILTMASFQRDLLDESDRTYAAFEQIRRSAARANRLIEDLLDVSRIDAGRLSVTPSDVEVTPLVDEVVALLRPAAIERAVILKSVIEPDAATVRADRDRLLQVLENLVSNAIKFTPGGGSVTVDVRGAPDGVEFAVRDTGVGIDAEALPHVFDRFWQARHARRAGAGLGLAIARGVVEAHGAALGVTSAPGRGTTFSFQLPTT